MYRIDFAPISCYSSETDNTKFYSILLKLKIDFCQKCYKKHLFQVVNLVLKNVYSLQCLGTGVFSFLYRLTKHTIIMSTCYCVFVEPFSWVIKWKCFCTLAHSFYDRTWNTNTYIVCFFFNVIFIFLQNSTVIFLSIKNDAFCS